MTKAPAETASKTVGRESLFWVFGALLLVVLPHASRLPLLVTALFLTMVSWRYMVHVYQWRPVSKILRLALAAWAILVVFNSQGTLVGQDAGISLLIAMLSIKVLEIHSQRDAYIAAMIGYFLVVTHFLYSQSIGTALYMFVAVLAITGAIVELNRHTHSSHSIKANLVIGGTLLVQSLPFMLLLFILFPRVGAPIWGMRTPQSEAVTGLSDSMQPGNISSLSRSDAVVFRATFTGKPPSPEFRYWRGPVLWYTDGRTWKVGRYPQLSKSVARTTGFRALSKPLDYSITLEPTNRPWLFALDLPISIPDNAILTPDLQLEAPGAVQQRIRYHVKSVTNYQMEGLTQTARTESLQLPPRLNPRARQLAETWRAQSSNPGDIISTALRHFHDQEFVYTLTPPPLTSGHVVDEFLFGTRRGFCEHYASSFVTLMRAAGIPARVVLGYQGGEFNPVGGYLAVRQRDAHAWSEVWLDGQGWARIDPTAAVAPERVEMPIDNSVGAEGEAVRFNAGRGPLGSLLRGIFQTWDSVNHGWNQWIINYNESQQRNFLRNLGLGIDSWRGMVVALAIGVVAILATLGLLITYKTHQSPDRTALAWRSFCRQLAKKGCRRHPSEGPRDFAARAAQKLPHLAEKIQSVATLYMALRYESKPIPHGLRRLRAEIRGIR